MRKPITRFALTLFTSITVSISLFAQKENDRVNSYIQQYKQLAIAEMQRTGVPASITLAQGILETGYGQSDLAINANNHFGIKCKSDWTGESVLHDDDKKGECFRKYPSVEDSYRDHSDFLKQRPNYASLFQIDPTDYKGWAYGLKKAGYATNPVYAEKLIKFIEDNKLQDYTLMALNGVEQTNAPTEIFAKATTPAVEMQDEIVFAVSGKLAATPSVIAARASKKNEQYPKGTPFSINNAKVLFVEAGTSLFAIAAVNNISFNKLLEFNDLSKADIVEKDQLIFLQKKQRKGSNDFHTVLENEDIYNISQAEGVQLSTLLDFNHLSKDSRLAVGQKIYLKAAAPASNKLAGTFSGYASNSME